MSKVKTEIPWVEKYRPKGIREMALPFARMSGQRVKLAEELTNFIKSFFEERIKINKKNKQIRKFNRTAIDKERKDELKIPDEKAAVLLEGPPGIGKTSIVYALANDFNMEVIETNASDTRTRATIEKRLKETTKTRGIMDFITQSKEKLILIDEIDGIYGVQDKGAIPTVIELIQNTQFPIIMCSNEYKTNLQPLYNKIRRYEVHPLPKNEVIKIAKNILKKENITNLKEEDLELIIDKNNGDLRGIINDIQGITQGNMEGDHRELILSLHRDNLEEIFSLIRDLFQVSSLREARNLTDKSDVDYNFLYKWINENLLAFIKSNRELAEAFENLSMADEIFGRIRTNQYWGLLPYFFDLFAGGVALSRKETPIAKGFRRVVFPRYTSGTYFSLTSVEKEFVEKLKRKYEISQIDFIQDFLPFLKILCGTSRKQLKNVSDWLELDVKEKKVLK
ncbi:MAG: replication factor C large subunit [Candidatus Lokiarchaeota archaeon]|nr:replication factor C large subunit [Candidatus Lokiarchaeota archaeon]